jgi:cholinesterase
MKRLTHLLATALTLAAAPATAAPYNDLIIFSGSLSDTGNFASVFGPLPPPFFNNRTTNGPNSVEVFARHFGFPAEPSLHLVSATGGNNYSVLGSRAGGSDPIDLPAQLDAYLARSHGTADPNTLYLVFIGGHEVRQAVFEPNDSVSHQIIDDTIAGIRTAIERLIDHGAREIYAPNFIDLAITPESRLHNLVDRAHTMSVRFNRRYERMLDDLECSRGIDIARFNFEKFINNALHDAARLRFSNTTDSCLSLLATNGCDFDRFLFFNEVFPTARVHELVGDAMALSFINRHGTSSRSVCAALEKVSRRARTCRTASCVRSQRRAHRALIAELRR